MGDKALAIHGHFYQPPREDPFTGEIPLEPGAAPYQNWNEKIFAHCYRPNVELGNFKRIGFNVGPTLFNWWENFDPITYRQVIADENENYKLNGIGNAIAQPYNHTILPLASSLDKITQIRWGIADFKARFGHTPPGMWLPETAVDLETLDILSQNRIEFTILAPWQADRKNVDTSQAYKVFLKDGRSIHVFFYNQEISTGVSFEPEVTVNGDRFIEKEILTRFHPGKRIKGSELILIASDGELYGHHQPFRDKFLAYISSVGYRKYPFTGSYPSLWLRDNPPTKEIKIQENTSWSCHHGVTRWEGICDCTPNATWKEPLRAGFNRIAQLLDEAYFDYAKRFFDDPWELRHGYADVLRKQVSFDEHLQRNGYRNASEEAGKKISLLLRSQCERQRMFTSCGWFFDDLDRIEPLNNVAYAAQAVRLTRTVLALDISVEIENLLKLSKSWRTGLNAGTVFRHQIERAKKNE